jgi:hypothetical protein
LCVVHFSMKQFQSTAGGSGQLFWLRSIMPAPKMWATYPLWGHSLDEVFFCFSVWFVFDPFMIILHAFWVFFEPCQIFKRVLCTVAESMKPFAGAKPILWPQQHVLFPAQMEVV